MNGKMSRIGCALFLVLMLLAGSLICASDPAAAYSWTDGFNSTPLDSRWTRGGIGELGIKTTTGTLAALSYTGGETLDWHGPSVRTPLPAVVDFSIDSQFRCLAEERGISRLMVRILDQSGAQLFSFGWSDILDTDDKSEIGLYGSSFSEPIFRTGASYVYSNFQYKNISLTRSGQNVSLSINGAPAFKGASVKTPAYFLEIAFLKHRNMCTLDVLDVNSISFSTYEVSVPGMPMGLQGAAGDGFVHLTWSPPTYSGSSPILNYRIYRGTEPGAESLLTSVQGTDFNNTGLANGQIYYYRVSAVNEVGEGAQSASISATPSTVPSDPVTPIDNPTDPSTPVTEPSMPMSVNCIGGSGYIFISWATPADNGGSPIVAYHLYRSLDHSPQSYMTLGIVNSYNDTAVTVGTPYHYWVAAVNSVGEGPISLEAVATPGSINSVPSAPRNLTATPGNGTVQLSWYSPLTSGNLPLLGYRLFRGASPGAETLLAELGDVSSYTDSGLTNNRTYYYKINAFNSMGEGPSITCSATPQPTPANYTDVEDDVPAPQSWTDDFSLTSSIVTLIALVAGLGIAFFFLRSPGNDKGVPSKSHGKGTGQKSRAKDKRDKIRRRN